MRTKDQPVKTERGKGRGPGLEGLISGLSTTQDEIRALIAFYIDIVTTALDFLKDEAERLGRRFQQERPNMPQNNQLGFTNAFMDYRAKRRTISRDLGFLAAYKRAMDSLHDLVEIEDNRDRLRTLHEMKVELMLNVLRILVDLMEKITAMSDDLKRAERNLSI